MTDLPASNYPTCEWCGVKFRSETAKPPILQWFGEESFEVHDRPCAREMWSEMKRTGELPMPKFAEGGRG